MTELIITNGDSAVDLMREAGIKADILPWRDVLHEGPVPETECLEQLSAHRAPFLANIFGLSSSKEVSDFERRDRTLRRCADYDEITLWFEHDLYDQLQLLQLLDFFHQELGSLPVYLVQADDYLGLQTPDGINEFKALKTAVSGEQMALAALIFGVFRKPEPAELAGYLDRDLSPLPHMKAALERLFEDLPDSRNGLSRTQRQILTVIEREGQPPKQLFGAVQAMEEAVFMGDWSFWRCLEETAFNRSPLVNGLPCRFSASLADEERRRYLDADLSLTDAGRAVLRGEADHAKLNDVDRWLGGTHILSDMIWRWDPDANALIAPL
ncbi:MAG: DUF1835 domain-containing protein [Geminicoccaceae bacterium]